MNQLAVAGTRKYRIVSYRVVNLITIILYFFYSGHEEAIERMAYEFCEDCKIQGIVYAEARYSPQFLSSSVKHDFCDPGSVTPRKVVECVNKGFKRGGEDFGVKVTSILCCIRTFPGTYFTIQKFLLIFCMFTMASSSYTKHCCICIKPDNLKSQTRNNIGKFLKLHVLQPLVANKKLRNK